MTITRIPTTQLQPDLPRTAPTQDLRSATAQVADIARRAVSVRDRDGTLPTEVLDAARSRGLTTALVPPTFGGGGAATRRRG